MSEALRLAEIADHRDYPTDRLIAAELRRLHAENEALREANESFGKRQEWWNDKMFALEERNAELVEALRMSRDALNQMWQSDKARPALVVAERALAKCEVSK